MYVRSDWNPGQVFLKCVEAALSVSGATVHQAAVCVFEASKIPEVYLTDNLNGYEPGTFGNFSQIPFRAEQFVRFFLNRGPVPDFFKAFKTNEVNGIKDNSDDQPD